MRVEAEVVCGFSTQRYSVPCGLGQNSVKWLGLACGQRFARDVPSQLPVREVALCGVVLDPHRSIAEVLSDGALVTVTLEEEVRLDASGTPVVSDWARLAFHRDSKVSAEDWSVSPESQMVAPEKRESAQSKVEFVRTTMNQQMLNCKKIEHIVDSFWDQILRIFPRIVPMSEEVKSIFVKNVLILDELFKVFASSGAMKLSEYQSFVEEANIFFPRKMSTALAGTAFAFTCNAVGEATELTFPMFCASLLHCAQLRFNDTYEKHTALLKPVEGLGLLFKVVRAQAERRRCECLVREALSSDEFLRALFSLRRDLFLVFERAERTDYSTLPLKHLNALLLEMKLQTEPEAKTKKLYAQLQQGHIYGRSSAAADTTAASDVASEDLLFFPEFIEAICRASYLRALEDGSFESSSLVDVFLLGLAKAVATLTAKPAADPKANLKRK